MRLRNNIFAAALDYLKREKGIKTQKRLAELMGVSEDTITRILKDRTDVTEDIITKLQTASGCIFNLQWLRGEDANNMLASDLADDLYRQKNESRPEIDFSSYINALLAKSDETIASLKRELAAKDEIIVAKDERIADLTKLAEERLHRIAELKRTIDANNLSEFPFPIGSAEDGIKPKRKQI
jgi:plasmid maintenance system antidote protein VapI